MNHPMNHAIPLDDTRTANRRTPPAVQAGTLACAGRRPDSPAAARRSTGHALARRLALPAALAVLLGSAPATGPAAAGSDALNGEQIRALIAGNQLHGGLGARRLRFFYRADGSSYATLGSLSDRGEWRIENDRLCQRWVRLFEHRDRCYEVHRVTADAGGRDLELRNVDAFRGRDLRMRRVLGLDGSRS